MDLEDIIEKAKIGDIESIIQLAEYYVDRQEWNEAIDWADKAAELNNTNGMYKSATLHNLRMISILKGGMPFWGLMLEDAKAIQKNAGILLAACQKGLIKLENNQYSYLLNLFKDALYCEAITFYFDENNINYARVIHLLKESDSPRDQLLYGVCCHETNQHKEAFRVLNRIYADTAYIESSKAPIEQAIFSIAILILSEMTRTLGDMAKAVSILQQGINGLSDKDLKNRLKNELEKYRLTVFGKWKYFE